MLFKQSRKTPTKSSPHLPSHMHYRTQTHTWKATPGGLQQLCAPAWSLMRLSLSLGAEECPVAGGNGMPRHTGVTERRHHRDDVNVPDSPDVEVWHISGTWSTYRERGRESDRGGGGGGSGGGHAAVVDRSGSTGQLAGRKWRDLLTVRGSQRPGLEVSHAKMVHSFEFVSPPLLANYIRVV